MRVAAAQIDCVPGAVQLNVDAMVQQVEEAAREGCNLIVFPELADVGYDLPLAAHHASDWQSEPIARLRDAAQKQGVAVVAGLSERDEDGVYNSAAAIDSDGDLVGRYRKLHLFSPPPADEPRFFARGNARCTLDLNGWRCRVAICYDLRFPESFRDLAGDPADLLVVCSAWPAVRAPHWRTLLAARAIENQAYVVAANRVGTDAGLTFAGGSLILSPTGDVLAEADDHSQTLIHANVSRTTLRQARAAIPVHRDARPDVYANKSASSPK